MSPVRNLVDRAEDETMTGIECGVSKIETRHKLVIRAESSTEARILKARAVIQRVSVRVARLKQQSMRCSLGRAQLHGVVTRITDRIDGSHTRNQVARCKRTVRREVLRLVVAARYTGRSSQTSIVSCLGDRIAFIGNLLATAKRSNIADSRHNVAWEFPLNGQVEIL